MKEIQPTPIPLGLEYRENLVKAKKYLVDEKKSNVYTNSDSPLPKYLKDKQKKIGIIGGGISILSSSEKKPLLLAAPEIQKCFKLHFQHGELEYIPSRYETKHENFINMLFFISRETICPEFVKQIGEPERNEFEYKFQHELREQYEILHCSSGEILFFSLIWRLVMELMYRNFCKKRETSIVIRDIDNSHYQAEKNNEFDEMLSSLNFDLVIFFLEKIEIVKSQDDEVSVSIHESYKEFKKDIEESTLTTIYEKLGLYADSTKTEIDTDTSIDELNKYLKLIFDDGTSLQKENMSEDYLLEFSTKILKHLSKHRLIQAHNLRELLEKLHTVVVRFPILPYYFLMHFDSQKNLKEHIVFPIWHTYTEETKYPLSESEKKSAVLHALYTIIPIWDIEKNKNLWYANSPNEKTCTKEFYNYLNELYLFFASFSKPIIDIEYYAKEYRKQLKNSIDTENAMKACYSFAHLIKNKLREPKEHVDSIIKVLQENSINSSSYMPKYEEFLKRYKNFGYTMQLLDMIPKAFDFKKKNENVYKVFALNSQYSSKKINIMEIVNDVSNEWEIKGHLNPEISNCFIEPFVKSKEGNIEVPARFIYEDCIIEIIINYKEELKKKIEKRLTIKKCWDTTPEKTLGICFCNEIKSGVVDNNFIEVDPSVGYRGAIGYLKSIFKTLEIGTIKRRITENNGKKYFELALFLNHINIS